MKMVIIYLDYDLDLLFKFFVFTISKQMRIAIQNSLLLDYCLHSLSI